MYQYREIPGEDHERPESPCALLGVKSSVKTPQRSEFGLSLEGESELAQRREGSLMSPPCTWREPGCLCPTLGRTLGWHVGLLETRWLRPQIK